MFSPSREEIERSRRLIQAYEEAQAHERGAIEFEGGMVDELLLRPAQAVVRSAADLPYSVDPEEKPIPTAERERP